MPGMDGTGPLGLGPGTGWGRGPCLAGRGRGLRRFRRLWRRCRFWNPQVGGYYDYDDYEPTKEDEPTKEEIKEDRKAIEEEIKVLGNELKKIQEKLKSFEIEE